MTNRSENAIKIACGYTIPITKYGLPPSLENHLKAMDEIRQAGFSAFEMELFAGNNEYIDGWHRVIQKSRDLNLDVPSIMAVTEEMFSLDTGRQKKAIDDFKIICDMVQEIGAGLITNCFYLPPELTPKVKTELYHGGPPRTIDIPAGFTWSLLYDIVIRQLTECSSIARERGLDFAMELRAGDFISSVDGLVYIFDKVGSDNIGVVFDTAHVHATKEYLELAILKFNKYIKLVHLSDNDGTHAYHLMPGNGNIDFKSLINWLKFIGYKGYLIVDISGIDDILNNAVKMKGMLEGLIHVQEPV
jgi:sugar phosphate isomerase/epimerase